MLFAPLATVASLAGLALAAPATVDRTADSDLAKRGGHLRARNPQSHRW